LSAQVVPREAAREAAREVMKMTSLEDITLMASTAPSIRSLLAMARQPDTNQVVIL